MKRRSFATVLSLAVLLAAGPALAAPRVVASIKPVHSLVAAVMQGVAEPALLVEGGSPHTHTLRPSEARQLAEADVVFWVGEGLETFLAHPLETLGADAAVVELADAEGVALEPRAEPGHAAEAPAEAAETHEDDRDHDHGAGDFHVWLDPANAVAMVEAIAARLSAADPANAGRYAANAAAERARIETLDAALAARLAPVADVPFLVFHDAYGHFAGRYGLAVVAAITVTPDRAPGAGRLREIQAAIARSGAACVFAEPQFEPRVVAVATEGTSVRTGTLDPLGTAIAAGPGQYHELMDDLADSLVSCLGNAG